jgi:hypothetical protein
MGCKTETTTINNREYRCTQKSVTDALVMLPRVQRVLSPVLSSVASGVNMDRETISPDRIMIALGGVELSDDFPNLVKELCKDAEINGEKIGGTFDMHFAEYPEDVLPVALFVLKVNFIRLIPGNLLNLVQKAKE